MRRVHVVCFPDNETESDADDVFGPKSVILSACYDFHLDNELSSLILGGGSVHQPPPANWVPSYRKIIICWRQLCLPSQLMQQILIIEKRISFSFGLFFLHGMWISAFEINLLSLMSQPLAPLLYLISSYGFHVVVMSLSSYLCLVSLYAGSRSYKTWCTQTF